MRPRISIRGSVRPSVRRSVGRSVGPSVRHTLLFRRFWAFWPYRSCPNVPVTSNMAPAHPHATGVAVYPALFNASLKSWYNSLKRAKASSTSLSNITYLLERDDGRFCRVASGPLHRGNLKCSDCDIFLWGWLGEYANETNSKSNDKSIYCTKPHCNVVRTWVDKWSLFSTLEKEIKAWISISNDQRQLATFVYQ